MAVTKLFLCLSSLVILTANPAYCAPQFWNYGWPAQQETVPRLPAKAVMPAEAVPNTPLSFMPSPFSPPLPTNTVSPQRNVPVAIQPRKLQKQDAIPESRLFIGPTTRVPMPQTRLEEAEVTTMANPVSDDTTTELSQTADASKKPTTIAQPKAVLMTTPPSTAVNASDLFGEQNLREFIPAGVAALGAVLGRTGCDLKAACLAGRLVPSSIHGQAMMLLAAESLIPAQWKSVFQAAKSSLIDRNTQDCSSFVCF